MKRRLLHHWSFVCSLSLLVVAPGCSSFVSSQQENEFLRDAEVREATRDYQGALQALERYLMDPPANSENWNPFFYALKAGDLALELEAPEQAMDYYVLAYEQGLSSPHLSDRIRLVARWHEERGEPHCALQLVDRYKKLDPLLFHLVADRLSRQMLKAAGDTGRVSETTCPRYQMLERVQIEDSGSD